MSEKSLPGVTIGLILILRSSSEVNHPLDNCLCRLGAFALRVLSSFRKAVLDSIKFAPHVVLVLIEASRLGGILVEEDHSQLQVRALAPCVTHSGNGSAGMTGIHYRISAAEPKHSHPDKRVRAEVDTLTSRDAPVGLHLKPHQSGAEKPREPRPCRAYRAPDSTNRKRFIQNKASKEGGGRMSQI